MVVQYHPYSNDTPPDLQNHLNTVVDSVNTLASVVAESSDIAELQDAETGRVTINGALTRYLYRYIHYRITSDAEGTTLIDPATFTGSVIYIGINNSTSTLPAGNAAYQSQAFAWSSGHNILYRVSGVGNIIFATQAAAVSDPFVEITINNGTVDTTDVSAAGLQGASAYESAVSEGFVGTESEWLASLEGDSITATGEDGNVTITDGGTGSTFAVKDPISVEVDKAVVPVDYNYALTFVAGQVVNRTRVRVSRSDVVFTYDNTSPYSNNSYRFGTISAGSATVSANSSGELVVSATTVDLQEVTVQVIVTEGTDSIIHLRTFSVQRNIGTRGFPEITITPKDLVFDANYLGVVTSGSQDVSVGIISPEGTAFTYDATDAGTANTFFITSVTDAGAVVTNNLDGTLTFTGLSGNSANTTVNVRYYDSEAVEYNRQGQILVTKNVATREQPTIEVNPSLVTLQANYLGQVAPVSVPITVSLAFGATNFTYDSTDAGIANTYIVTVNDGSASVTNNNDGTLTATDIADDADSQVVSVTVKYYDSLAQVYTVQRTVEIIKNTPVRDVPVVTQTRTSVVLPANYLGVVTGSPSESISFSVADVIGSYVYDNAGEVDDASFRITVAADDGVSVANSNDGTLTISNMPQNQEVASVVISVEYQDRLGQDYSQTFSIEITKNRAIRLTPNVVLDRTTVALEANYLGVTKPSQSEVVTFALLGYTYGGSSGLYYSLDVAADGGASVTNNADGTLTITNLPTNVDTTSVSVDVTYNDTIQSYTENYRIEVTKVKDVRLAPGVSADKQDVVLVANSNGVVDTTQPQVVTFAVEGFAYDASGEIDNSGFRVSVNADGGATIVNNNDGTLTFSNLPANQTATTATITLEYRDAEEMLYSQIVSINVFKNQAPAPLFSIGMSYTYGSDTTPDSNGEAYISGQAVVFFNNENSGENRRTAFSTLVAGDLIQIGSTRRAVATVDAGSSDSVQINVTEAWPTITGTQVTAITRALTGSTGSQGNTVARFEVFMAAESLPGSVASGSYNVDLGVLTPPADWSLDVPDGNTNIWRAIGNLNTDVLTGPVSVPFAIDSTVAYSDGLRGIQGNTSFQDIAFAANSTGTNDFSFTPSDARRYEGVYTYAASTRQSPQSTTPTDYVWREIRVANDEIAATQALVSYSNGLVFVQAPNNGDYTPAPVSNEIISRVDVVFQTSEGSSLLARVSRNVIYNTTTNVFTQATTAHPLGDFNPSRVTATPTITANSVEFAFVYSHDGRQANAEAEVFLVQGGGAGPSNLRRFRTATDAGVAGRPSTASGLDADWVDNPDLLDFGTLFESTQQVVVTQDGNPYSTDLTFAGTSGGAYVPAQPEIQTITVDPNAQTSTNNLGVGEIINFDVTGTPGNDGDTASTVATFPRLLDDGISGSEDVTIEFAATDVTNELLAERVAIEISDAGDPYGIGFNVEPRFELRNTVDGDLIDPASWDEVNFVFTQRNFLSVPVPVVGTILVVRNNDNVLVFEVNSITEAGWGVGARFFSSGSPQGLTFLSSEVPFFIPSVTGNTVSVRQTNIGAVTGNVTFNTTQNSGNIMYSTPVETASVTTDNASDVTLRFEDNDGMNRDLVVMFTEQLDANGVASVVNSSINDTATVTTVAGRIYDSTFSGASEIEWIFTNSLIEPGDPWPTDNTDIRFEFGDIDEIYDFFSAITLPGFVRSGTDSDIIPIYPTVLSIIERLGQYSATAVVESIDITQTTFATINLGEVTASSGNVPEANDTTYFEFTTTIEPNTGFSSAASGNIITVTSEENEPRAQTTVVNTDAGTNGNISNSSFTVATTQDGIAPDSVATGTRSSLVLNGSETQTITFDPGTNLTTGVLPLIEPDTLDMYVSASGSTIDLESYTRALGGDFTFTATFNPGDSSTASMVQSNEVSGTNEVHDGTQIRWSRAIQVGTIS